MRSLLASIVIAATVVLSVPATAFAGGNTKSFTTGPNVGERTREWSGRKGNWTTTGKTRYLFDGMKMSTWTSRNHVTGETKSGTARSRQGYSSVSIATENRAGKTTVKLMGKVAGQPGTKTVR